MPTRSLNACSLTSLHYVALATLSKEQQSAFKAPATERDTSKAPATASGGNTSKALAIASSGNNSSKSVEPEQDDLLLPKQYDDLREKLIEVGAGACFVVIGGRGAGGYAMSQIITVVLCRFQNHLFVCA